MSRIRIIVFFSLGLVSHIGFTWNAMGHRMVAQIAYQQLTPSAKVLFERYNQALNLIYQPSVDFVESAVWLDTLSQQKVKWFQALHYVDLPFSEDKTPLVMPSQQNVLTGIHYAISILLNSKASDFDKGLALRILIHLVGDIHQPMHVISAFSHSFPDGDKGGNLYQLPKNSIAPNLHAYWDRGGGFLLMRKKLMQKRFRYFTANVCNNEQDHNINTTDWAKVTYWLAIKKAYQPLKVEPLNINYQNEVKKITEAQIHLAGCRLGYLLNKIAR